MKHNFLIFADYHMVWVQDEDACKNGGDMCDIITDQACTDMLAIGQGTICIMTVRNMTVPVEIEICDNQPIDNLDEWDQVVECGIDIPSGETVIYGTTDDTSQSPRITLLPGSYRARIYYGNLDSVNGSGTEGDDTYKVVLYPGTLPTTHFLKKYEPKESIH
jgi:hypothetical protein